MSMSSDSRRSFLKGIGVGAAALALKSVGLGAAAPAASSATDADKSDENRPNVVWLISEDTSPDLGCYGHPLVKTPNLDRLAGEGMRFTNAFVTGPVCSAARSAFMTGMYQTSIGAHNHRSHRGDGYSLPPPVQVLSEYFRAAGYFTCNGYGVPDSKPGKNDFNFNVERPFDGTDWSQRRPGQPFFAQVNCFLTHRDFVRDRENPISPETVVVPPCYPDHPLTRRDWADYLESVQVLDRQVAKVLARLEDEGLADNTIVLYFGDHGRPHLRAKQWLYEGGIRIPLLARWPGHIEPGVVNEDLVSAIDFAPTSLTLAGIEPPDHMDGQVFLGPNAGKRDFVFAARDRCDETVDRIRCVRTKRFKYIRNYHPERPYMQHNNYKQGQYPVYTLMQVLHKRGELTPEQASFMAATRPREELYDLQQDPHEVHNLADDPGSREVLESLRARLDKWVEETGDHGETPEDKEALADWIGQARDYSPLEARGLPRDISPEEYLAWWEEKML